MSKKEGKKNPKHHDKLIKGVIDVTRSGIGYVIVDGEEKDIFIRPHHFNRALHGDTVNVKTSESRGKRIEGRVVEVIERKQTEFIGNIEVTANFAFFKPDSQKPMPDFYISTKNLNGAKNNDRVVVRLLNWDNDEKKPEGEVVSVIQAKDVNDMAMKEILVENGFPLAFSKEVLNETAQLTDAINEDEIGKRRDCRGILTFTIDPADAKDFDDALSIKKLSDELYEMGVHIADVSHFVKPGTELDESGFERATSVYLPDRVNPMLPEKISNELCSLRPNEDKCTFSVIFRINKDGIVKDYWLGKTIIHSNHRFTYEEVQQIIDEENGLYIDEILLLNKLAQQFRSERFKNGAINFSSTEVKFVLDENGKPIGVMVKESTESHQLIEEFMLLANRTVAEHVSKIYINEKPVPFPYRIHDTPDDEKLKPFVAFAKKFGYHFNMHDEAAVAASFNKLLLDVKGKPEQHVLEQLGIRTMAKAIYTSENVGHYGLGFEHYCHFTSPIRRYPDVMVHRVLQGILEKNVKPDKKMEEKCKHCSQKERAAMEAERAGNKYKQVEFMQDYVGEEFEGVISGVSSFGFWVETVLHKCEGLVSVRDLSEYDDFRLDETDYALVGLRTGRKFRMGDLINIKLVSANLGKRQLDFEWVPGAGSKKEVRSKKKETGSKKAARSKKKRILKKNQIVFTSYILFLTSSFYSPNFKSKFMHSFSELSKIFEERFNVRHFPHEPVSLYNASQYILSMGGKRIRPVMCLMGNELFNEINPDSFHVATAVELFHNFSLIHDDIMDKAPLRRGFQTVHTKFGESTALLAGDVMLVMAYEYINKIKIEYLRKAISIFNNAAREVCEGQQIDMDFAKIDAVSEKENLRIDEYIKMIELKTSVLLAASLQLGAVLGGGGLGNQQHLYEFGKNLGIAFQVQDDYLDAFGDPEKFGKQVGGDILANKKTFLLIHVLEVATERQLKELRYLLHADADDKVEKFLQIYKDCNVDDWAKELKERYLKQALYHLEEIAVLSLRKKPLIELAEYLIERKH